MKSLNKPTLKPKDITLMAMMVAVIEVCKVALAQVPNVELTSFLIILFTLYFGKRIFCVIPVFVFIEGVIFGFGLWWVMYLYAWPLLAIVTLRLTHLTSTLSWSLVSGVFGLLFGFFCAIPYLFIGGPSMAFSWWIAGIPWDLVHGAANFAIMLVLYKPVQNVLNRL